MGEAASARTPLARPTAQAVAAPSAPSAERSDAAMPLGSPSAQPATAPSGSEEDPNNPYND
jgi:hypothetical protein